MVSAAVVRLSRQAPCRSPAQSERTVQKENVAVTHYAGGIATFGFQYQQQLRAARAVNLVPAARDRLPQRVDNEENSLWWGIHTRIGPGGVGVAIAFSLIGEQGMNQACCVNVVVRAQFNIPEQELAPKG